MWNQANAMNEEQGQNMAANTPTTEFQTQVLKQLQTLNTAIQGLQARQRQETCEKAKVAKAPVACKLAVRTAYKMMSEVGSINKFNFDEFVDHTSNILIIEKIAREVVTSHKKEGYHADTVTRSVKRYFRSLKDKQIRERTGAYEIKKTQSRRNSRKRVKLHRRKAAVIQLKNITENKKRLIKEKLSVKIMSAEETDDEEDEEEVGKQVKRTRFAWESAELKELKEKLDQIHFEGLTQLQKRSKLPLINNDQLVDTTVPADLPNSWVD